VTFVPVAANELWELVVVKLQRSIKDFIGRPMTPAIYGDISTIVYDTIGRSEYSDFYKEHLAVEVGADKEDRNKVSVLFTPRTEVGRELLLLARLESEAPVCEGYDGPCGKPARLVRCRTMYHYDAPERAIRLMKELAEATDPDKIADLHKQLVENDRKLEEGDPNKDLWLCDDCAHEYNSYWDDMWSEYWRDRL
jgi:hypothetical protein